MITVTRRTRSVCCTPPVSPVPPITVNPENQEMVASRPSPRRLPLHLVPLQGTLSQAP